MADIISDDRLRREARELLDGKAKTLLDNNQLTMRIMRKLLEEKLGLAEGSLEAKKKAICAFVKEALALEPNTTAAAKAQSPKGAATASAAAAVPGGSTGSHKENQKPSGASNISDSNRKAAKSGGQARQADADAPSGGAPRSAKGRPRDVEKVQRRNGKKRTAVSESGRESSDGDSGQERDEEEAGKSQKKRAKKTRHGSPGPVSGEGANVAKGKAVTSRAIEMMKEVCKKATIKIGPTLYVRNKTVSELETALAELLARHGLDAHSHDKQIGQARRHLERNRDLEGIDTSNIISEGSGRPRRAAASSINFRQMFKQPKVDSEDEQESEEEDQDAENNLSARKRLNDHKASKIKAKRNVDDDKDNEEQENSQSGSESEAGEDDAEVDEAEEQERARVPARPGKAIAATTRAKGKHQASAKQQRSGRRKKVDGSGEGSGDSDDEPSESSEDLVDVTHGLKKGRGAARACRGGAKKADKKAGAKGSPRQHGSVCCESVEEGLEDSDVEPQPAKKIVTAKTKTRRVVDEDDNEEEEEEEGATSVTEEEEVEVEDEVDADDSDFELVDDDD